LRKVEEGENRDGASAFFTRHLTVTMVVARLPASSSRVELLGDLCESWEDGEESCGRGE
jgi:hypothetical protein